MKLWSNSFRDGGLIPAEFAFALLDSSGRVGPAANRNPHLAWEGVPNGTESLALFCYDRDAPLDLSLANRSDVVLAPTLPRGDFFHWSLIDIPLAMDSIAEGHFSDGITAHGKAAPLVPWASNGGHYQPLRQGLNDYTGALAGDAAMAGDYYGYDGPCPPSNDERIHHYIFHLYALDVPALTLGARFTGAQARAAIRGHILDEAQLIGAYSLHPLLAVTLKK